VPLNHQIFGRKERGRALAGVLMGGSPKGISRRRGEGEEKGKERALSISISRGRKGRESTPAISRAWRRGRGEKKVRLEGKRKGGRSLISLKGEKGRIPRGGGKKKNREEKHNRGGKRGKENVFYLLSRGGKRESGRNRALDFSG